MNNESKNSFLECIVAFYPTAVRLKDELRHSWLVSGRRESVAEHTWSCMLLAFLLTPCLNQPVQLDRVLQLLLVHDLPEALTGDVPVFEQTDPSKKHEDWDRAIQSIKAALGERAGTLIENLCREFEEGKTLEAKIAQAIDKIEAQMQHNEACLSTWLEVERHRAAMGIRQIAEFDEQVTYLHDIVFEKGRRKIKTEG